MPKKDLHENGRGKVDIQGITFVEAGDNPAIINGFEPSRNLDSVIASLIGPSGRNMDAALDRLTVNGNKADAFKLIWDYLDDAYVGAANYYVTELNEAFVRLGVEYAQYLQDGGVPLTDVVVKYVPDNASDSNDTPERLQSMHDNLLGNFNATDFNSRFTGALRDQLVDYLDSQDLSDLLTRPVFSGSDDVAGDALDTIAWDVEHGYLGAYDRHGRDHHGHGKGHDHDRHDDKLHAKNYDREIGDLDPSSTKNGAGTEMEVGAGIPDTNFNIFVNHDADIELGLKLHRRGSSGADITHTSVDPDGTANYVAPRGTVSPTSTTANWNFDFSVNTGIEGSNKTLDSFDFRIVIESGDGERAVFDLEHLGPGLTPWLNQAGAGFSDDDGLNPQLSQNSVNLGFSFMQAIFGTDYNNAGEHYDIHLQAFDGNRMIGEVHNSIDII